MNTIATKVIALIETTIIRLAVILITVIILTRCQMFLIMILITSTVTITVTMTIAKTRITTLRKAIIFLQTNIKNNTNSRVKYKTKKPKF